MKKIYLLLPILLMTSCGSGGDDNTEVSATTSNGNNDPILVTKMVSDGETSNFTYDGSKLVQVKNITAGITTNFTYSGDLITKTVSTESNSATTTTYTYDGNSRLSKSSAAYTSGNATYITETNYTYPSSNTVKMVSTVSTAGMGITKTYTKNAILNSDGSLKSWTETVAQPNATGGAGTGNLTVVYDAKNKPFKNVTGYIKLIYSEDENGSNNNIVDYNHLIQYSNGAEWGIFKSIYEYNSSNYPTKNTRRYYDKTGTSITNTEITTYEYNHL